MDELVATVNNGWRGVETGGKVSINTDTVNKFSVSLYRSILIKWHNYVISYKTSSAPSDNGDQWCFLRAWYFGNPINRLGIDCPNRSKVKVKVLCSSWEGIHQQTNMFFWKPWRYNWILSSQSFLPSPIQLYHMPGQNFFIHTAPQCLNERPSITHL